MPFWPALLTLRCLLRCCSVRRFCLPGSLNLGIVFCFVVIRHPARACRLVVTVVVDDDFLVDCRGRVYGWGCWRHSTRGDGGRFGLLQTPLFCRP